MNRLLLILALLFLSLQGIGQYHPDWAFHIGREFRDFEPQVLSVDNKDNCYIAGNNGTYFDFDPTHEEAYLQPDQSPKETPYIACYDSTGQYKWAYGWIGSNSNLIFKDIKFDSQDGMYVWAFVSGKLDYSFEESDTTELDPMGQVNVLVHYDSNQQLQWVHQFSTNYQINEIKILDDQIWIAGAITDSAYIDIINDDQQHIVTDGLPNYLNSDGLIAIYDTSLNLLTHTILNSPTEDRLIAFDITEDKLIGIVQVGQGLANSIDSIRIDNVMIPFDQNADRMIIRMDHNLQLLTVIDSAYSGSFSNNGVLTDDEFGFLVWNSNQLDWYGWDNSILVENQGENIFQDISITDIQANKETNVIYFIGNFPSNTKLVRLTDNADITPTGTQQLFNEIDFDDFNLIPSEISGAFSLLAISPLGTPYTVSPFAESIVLFSNDFLEYSFPGTHTNAAVARFVKYCHPPLLNSISPLEKKHCGFGPTELEVSASGTGLRYSWFEGVEDLEDIIYEAVGFGYEYRGTTSPYLLTTIPNAIGSTDTLTYYCYISSYCTGDTLTPTSEHRITPKAEPFIYVSNNDLSVGDSVTLYTDISYDPPANYQWFGNNIPLFDNSVFQNTTSDSLIIINARAYHSGQYYLRITPTECPELKGESNPTTITIALPIGLEETYSDQGAAIFPIPATDKLNIIHPSANIQSVSVYDMLGNQLQVKTNHETSRETILNIADLETGNYVLDVLTQGGTQRLQIFKN